MHYILRLSHAALHVALAGCGYGVSLKLLAEAYPNSTFHGIDISKVALAAAADRTSGHSNVTLLNPGEPGQEMKPKQYDFALTVDAVHDMTQPEAVLKGVRAALKVVNFSLLRS